MRPVIFGFVLLFGATRAFACNTDMLSVTDWSIKPLDSETNELNWTVKSSASKPIRLIDGSVGFKDALGGSIASQAIDRDAHIPANGTYSESGRWGQFTFERLLKLRREDVTPFTCVRAVVYDDGSKEQFN